ncbi:MAG: RecQ family ATP-dependent DNA helicase, partial [bacterium]|nr:RecQ family ATP-dependent DNA helicase [bacterium]
DQVDSLVDMDIKAACLNSSMRMTERRDVINRLKAGEIKLLYISPERLRMESTISLLQSVKLSFFVIDEAHCISHWGHDFRADYRHLYIIKEAFDSVGVHGFTATATEEVQRDIIVQLRLDTPDTHIGPVDRPNLVYRTGLRVDLIKQIQTILERHRGEPGIIYCLRRKDVDKVSEQLNDLGFKNVPYHAGLSDNDRHRNQDRFLTEEVDIVVATIAFGMGIDRSNVRFVLHAAMPKTIEHYQQETGRAGRDGLLSNCYLLYGGGDYHTHNSFVHESPNRDAMMDKIGYMFNFCTRPQCRHRVLVSYFGQEYEAASCGACDFCLGEVDMVEDPLVVGQKILSCVYRVNHGESYGFGAGYITSVLKGSNIDRIKNNGHQSLSTFGLMSSETITYIRFMIEQLVGQRFLQRHPEHQTLFLTETGGDLLKGEAVPALAKPLVAKKKKEIARKRREIREEEWAGVDRGLFSLLRDKRRELARAKGVPPFIIFGDRSLKDMALLKPLNKEEFTDVFGVGERKLEQYSEPFIEVIKTYLEGGETETTSELP